MASSTSTEGIGRCVVRIENEEIEYENNKVKFYRKYILNFINNTKFSAKKGRYHLFPASRL